jgi:histidine triad (HIT) family protein
MHNHAPLNYDCPFCLLVQKVESEHNQLRQSDIVYQDDVVTAFIALRKWPNNRGHVLVIPNRHFENIYDLPLPLASRIHEVARAVALAMKQAYGCDGILIRQQNEPAGGQRLWHYHMHVIPRYNEDGLLNSTKQLFPVEERANFAQELRPLIALD